MPTPNARGVPGPLATLTAALLLAATAAPVAAEPLQLVDVFDETDLAGGLDNTQSLRLVGENRVVALVQTPQRTSGEGSQKNLLLFSRDPATGGLELLDRVERVSERTEPGLRELLTTGIAVAGNTVWAMGQASPETCSAAPCDLDTVVFAYTVTEDGRLSFAYQVTFPFNLGNLIASPDGRFLYRAGSQTMYTLRVQEIGNLVQTGRTEYNDPAVTSDPHHHSVVLSPDGRHMYVSLRSEPGIVVFRTDPETGVPIFVERIDGDESLPLDERATMAVSPDGSMLYVASRSGPGSDAGVLSFRIGPGGALDYDGFDDSANRAAPGTSENPVAMTLSRDGRQLFVHDNDRVIHKYTSDADGAFTYRGFEQNELDGVPARTIDSLAPTDTMSLAVSGDAGVVHYANRVGGIATFDNRADLAVSFDADAGDRTDEATAASRVVLFNAGPADAHGIALDITSDTDLVSSSLPGICTITGTSARCTIDRLRANVPLELDLVSALDAGGAATLDARATAIETDPDEFDNTARTSVSAAGRVIDQAPGTAGSPVAVSEGGAAGEDSAGGCSIAGTGRSDSMLALLLGAALFGTLRRRRPARLGREGA